jgi:hypothetical protein
MVPYLRNWSLIVGVSGGLLLAGAIFALFLNGVSPESYWKVGLVLLGATLFFWSMRILVKLLFSNIHLEADAHEREVMTMTYLSLLRDQSGLEESDKKLVLATLFRPGSSGLGNDDGIPPGVYDVLTRLASRP